MVARTLVRREAEHADGRSRMMRSLTVLGPALEAGEMDAGVNFSRAARGVDRVRVCRYRRMLRASTFSGTSGSSAAESNPGQGGGIRAGQVVRPLS